MKIGIIVYSYTGNTYSVAEKIYNKLISAGLDVELIRLQLMGDWKPGSKDVALQQIPNIDGFDQIIFGTPVQGFTFAMAMKHYLDTIDRLDGKEASLFVTQHFPYPWMGGKRAISLMRKICISKGAKIKESAVINWSNKQREKMIDNTVERMSESYDK
ncbi:MAG: NAD(P)H-dependent oxidoreductase [Eubacteriales bacterium]|nr:NAD(P)H-dependent oxidoreductase [Eubacteriales bacterium]